MYDLSRHTAVITGASSGIGAAVARVLAAGGARLILAARRDERLQALADDLGLADDRILLRPTDVTQEVEVQRLFAEAEAFSPVTLLVANAGVAVHRATTEMTLGEWQAVIDINLTAAFLCAREAFRVMKPRGRGRIINIGSLSAQMPRADTIAYTATKFALDGLTHSLALDGRPYGITASIVHPGSTITELAGQSEAREPTDKTMAVRHVADLVALTASVPDEVNILASTILPIAQPYLGRG